MEDDEVPEPSNQSIGADAEKAAFALIRSISVDGEVTPDTRRLAIDYAGHRMMAAQGDPQRVADVAAFLGVLLECLASLTARAFRDLEKRGVDVTFNGQKPFSDS